MRKVVIAVLIVWCALTAASLGVWYYLTASVPLLGGETPVRVFGPVVWGCLGIVAVGCCVMLVVTSARTRATVLAALSAVVLVSTAIASAATFLALRAVLSLVWRVPLSGPADFAWVLLMLVCAVEMVLIAGSVSSFAQAKGLAAAHA